VILTGQIATLEAAAKADQRALEDKKKAAADEIKGIQQIQKAEETRTAKAVADIRGQIKEQDAQSAALIKGLQAEMKTEKERVDDQILQLDKVLKAQQGLASGTGAAWGSAFKTIGTAADTAKQKIDDLNASLAATASAIKRDNAPVGSGLPGGQSVGGHPGGLGGDFSTAGWDLPGRDRRPAQQPPRPEGRARRRWLDGPARADRTHRAQQRHLPGDRRRGRHGDGDVHTWLRCRRGRRAERHHQRHRPRGAGCGAVGRGRGRAPAGPRGRRRGVLWVYETMTAIISSAATIASTSLDTMNAGHTFRMADGRLVEIWKGTDDLLYRSSSTDGVTWSTPASVSVGANVAREFVAAVQNGDTIYGVSTVAFTKLWAFKMAYAAGAFTDSSAEIVYTSIGLPPALNSARIVYDSVKTCLHAVVDAEGNVLICAINTSLGLIKDIAISGTLNPTSVAIAVDSVATPNVYVGHQTGATVGLVMPYTFNGTTYTAGTVETAIASGLTVNSLSFALDQSALLDLFWVGTGTLNTRKRTGVNTYGAVTTIIGSGVYQGPNTSLARTGNGNADLFVIYEYTGNQAAGEIYQVKRLAGVWQTAALIAGGASTGWSRPSAISLIQSDSKAHMVYITGTGTDNLVYNGSLLNGTAPSASTNNLPTGNANSALTPTCSCTYKNTVAGDALGKYRVLVTRVSDLVVMWDTGSGGTAWVGSAITDGQTFAIVYAGTGLAKGITYQVQTQFWDSIGSLSGPLSGAVTFQVNDAPAIAITSSATPSTSGPTITWTYSQTLSHAQLIFQITVIRAGVTVYDSGVQVSAATSFALPGGTLTNSVAQTISLTCLSTDGL